MKKINIFLTLLTTTLFVGCVNETFETPELSNRCGELTVTKTPQDIAALATGTVQSYNTVSSNTPDVIEAYVTSSDEGGNFYKNISLVSVDGAKGFTMPINDYNLYTKFEPGRKVFIKMKNLHFYNNSTVSSLEIGNRRVLGAPQPDQIGRLEINEYQDIISRSCTKVDESEILNTLTIPAALNNANLNKLIELENVQFSEGNVGQNYYNPANQIGGATNNIAIDNAGNQIVVRVSEFATFAGAKIPKLNGKIRGVLTKFGSGFQLMIRTLNDVNLTNPYVDMNPPVGGTTLAYTGAFTENFESYTSGTTTTTGQYIFPKYINDAAAGTKYWRVNLFSGNKYLVMSAFNNSAQDQLNKVYFIMPIDFTAANGMSFQTQDRFNVGAVLKVYTSTDYVPGSDITTATLNNITSNFTIASGNTGSTTQPFVNSGLYSFPTTLTGNGYIIFEYTGGYSFNPVLTSNMHIDNIVVN